MVGSEAERFDIVALGEPMVEFNQAGGDPRQYLQGFGGDTSNFAIAAARSGARVAYVSRIGDDLYGAMLRRLWDDEGVDHRHVTTDLTAFTAIYFVTHDAAGHHFSFFRQGSAASRMRSADLPLSTIRHARVLHLSGISLAISPEACDAGYAAIAAARAAGVRVSFDTNLRLRLWSLDRARAIISDVIGLADICLPSYDDVSTLTGLTDPDALVDFCRARGAGIVALKLGAQGAIVDDGIRRFRVPPVPCHPVDATGAGDTFGGAFLARLVAGQDVVSAAAYAAAAAAISTEGFGAVAPIPGLSAVAARLADAVP